jgi:hypothetical protein
MHMQNVVPQWYMCVVLLCSLHTRPRASARTVAHSRFLVDMSAFQELRSNAYTPVMIGSSMWIRTATYKYVFIWLQPMASEDWTGTIDWPILTQSDTSMCSSKGSAKGGNTKTKTNILQARLGWLNANFMWFSSTAKCHLGAGKRTGHRKW